MTSSQLAAESFSRTAKIAADSGQAATLQEALDLVAGWSIQIAVGPDATHLGHHAALLTAVATASRAVGTVRVALPPALSGSTSHVPFLPGTVAEAVTAAGGTVVAPGTLFADLPTAVVGAVPDAVGRVVLQITWDGWTAAVDPDQGRLPESGNMPLAPAAAAALAVAETFGVLTDRPDSGLRRRTLSLWAPAASNPADIGPELRRLPDGAWLVGLGHLGQAYAWCWGLLPYRDRTECTLVLQDDDTLTEANHSTGLLVRPCDAGTLKTRAVAAAFTKIGHPTRLIERRLGEGQAPHPHEPHLALLGVDNVTVRRAITSCGWLLAVDAGLGSGPTDYSAINIKVFPDHGDSTAVAAWATEPADRGDRASQAGAYRHALDTGSDPCGVVMLAGRAAAASFVGVMAGALVIANVLRRLHGDGGDASLVFDAHRTAPPRAVSGCGEPVRIGYIQAR